MVANNAVVGTVILGDVGVSPGTEATGFPPGVVVGTIHAGDTVAAQAQADLTAAYDDAAGRSVDPVTVSGNLGGMTLEPGLYKSTSSLEISSGNLTLDAMGDPNAVFIFQMAGTLTTTSERHVILAGGAQASNIFWQVGSSATLGTTSVFKGTILAAVSITFNTGATLSGRALAKSGEVTLDSNMIVAYPISKVTGCYLYQNEREPPHQPSIRFKRISNVENDEPPAWRNTRTGALMFRLISSRHDSTSPKGSQLRAVEQSEVRNGEGSPRASHRDTQVSSLKGAFYNPHNSAFYAGYLEGTTWEYLHNPPNRSRNLTLTIQP
jgi:hypothetical protein